MRKTAVLVILMALVAVTAHAASPDNGTLTPTVRSVDYTGSGPYVVPAPSNDVDTCLVPGQCDIFTLTVDLPSDFLTANCNDMLHFEVSWVDPTANADF